MLTLLQYFYKWFHQKIYLTDTATSACSIIIEKDPIPDTFAMYVKDPIFHESLVESLIRKEIDR